jgi:hypothetical protein
MYHFKKSILEHNHILSRSPSMIKQMSEHKLKEATILDMINIMHKTRFSHVKVMHVLNESDRGSENLNITKCDIQNR